MVYYYYTCMYVYELFVREVLNKHIFIFMNKTYTHINLTKTRMYTLEVKSDVHMYVHAWKPHERNL